MNRLGLVKPLLGSSKSGLMMVDWIDEGDLIWNKSDRNVEITRSERNRDLNRWADEVEEFRLSYGSSQISLGSPVVPKKKNNNRTGWEDPTAPLRPLD